MSSVSDIKLIRTDFFFFFVLPRISLFDDRLFRTSNTSSFSVHLNSGILKGIKWIRARVPALSAWGQVTDTSC